MRISASITTLLILAVLLCLHPGSVSSTQHLETPQTHQPSTVAIPLIRARRRGLARRSAHMTPEEAAEKAREAAAAAMAREAAAALARETAERAREAAERAREALEKANAAAGAGQGNESTGGDDGTGDSGNAGGSD